MSGVGELILETARRGELHHAIILHGPHAGDMHCLAIAIAKAANCIEGTTGDDCLACRKIDRGIHPDVHDISVDASRTLISIEQIRSMIAEATLRPYEGRTKVFIVGTADAMSISGANALLKTLEEPAGDTLFILITRSADRLLPTIRSRSQSIAIRHSAPEPAAELARRGGLSVQEARIRASAASVEEGTEVVALVRELAGMLARFARDRESALLLAIAARLASHPDVRVAVAAWVTLLRDLASLPARDAIAPEDFEAIRIGTSASTLLASATLALRNLDRLSVNADARFMIEQAVIRLAEPPDHRR